MIDLIGKTLSHFRIKRELAAGNRGTLFRARDEARNRDVALKVFPCAQPESQALEQHLDQLRPILGLEHAHWVALHEHGHTREVVWIAMEYIDGEDLTKQLDAAGPTGMIDWQHALRFGIHLASGLEALHDEGLVQGHLWPRDVLVARADRRARLGGLWRATPMKHRSRRVFDARKGALEKAYAPPEEFETGATPTVFGDIYRLGAVLYHLMAGRPPFARAEANDLLRDSDRATPPSLREFQLLIPPSFDRAMQRMLAARPEDRYASASEALGALQNVLAGPERCTDGAPGYSPPALSTSLALSVSVPPHPTVLSVADTAISVECKCGEMLQARRQFAGTRVRCPSCGGFIHLPGRAPFFPPPAPEPRRSSAHNSSSSRRTARVLVGEVFRYLLLVILLLGTLGISLSGIVLNHPTGAPASDKAKSEGDSKRPAESPKRQSPR